MFIESKIKISIQRFILLGELVTSFPYLRNSPITLRFRVASLLWLNNLIVTNQDIYKTHDN